MDAGLYFLFRVVKNTSFFFTLAIKLAHLHNLLSFFIAFQASYLCFLSTIQVYLTVIIIYAN